MSSKIQNYEDLPIQWVLRVGVLGLLVFFKFNCKSNFTASGGIDASLGWRITFVSLYKLVNC